MADLDQNYGELKNAETIQLISYTLEKFRIL